MNSRFSLSDKIGITITTVGVFAILMVFYISDSYKSLTYQHHAQLVSHLARLEAGDIIGELKANSLDLALTIESEINADIQKMIKLDKGTSLETVDELARQLDNQFYQYFVSSGMIKLLKLYVLDTDFTLISQSNEGIKTDIDSGIICPQLSLAALNRHGSEKLQTISRLCLYRSQPVFAVIVPFGGLNPKGYIQVITDLSHNLQNIEQSIEMPLQIQSLDGYSIYESKAWNRTSEDHLDIDFPIINEDNRIIMSINLRYDMSDFNKHIDEYRNMVIMFTFITITLTVLIILLILHRSTLPSLTKIHDILEKIQLHSYSNTGDSRLLFEQLVEQIIYLRQRNRNNFSVILLNLSSFNKVSNELGKQLADELQAEVEKRLGKVLRDSDLTTWTGTTTAEKNILTADSKAKYRATVTRLGGDEFGLLLPSAQTEKQAKTVARRIVDTLNKSFQIKKHEVHLECKVGISVYPEHGADEHTLINNADKAMLRAKQEDKSIVVYTPAEDTLQ